MKRSFVFAVAGAVAIVGAAPTQAVMAAEAVPSLEHVRAQALADMNAGKLVEVQRKRGARRGYRGNRGWRGSRGFRRDRGWRGNRGYRNRGYYGRRYYGGRRGYRRDRGAAVAAGIAGLAVGAAIASSQPRYGGSSSCAQRYRSYDPRTGTWVDNSGRVRTCP